MIPSISPVALGGFSSLYTLNSPLWSLMFEYAGNVLYGVILSRINTICVLVTALVGAFFQISVGLNFDFTGLVPGNYTINYGFSLGASHFYVGAVRLLFSFTTGILLSRLRVAIRIRRGFCVSSLILLILFETPQFIGNQRWLNGVFELICTVVIFPIIILLGIESNVSGNSLKICKFLGDLSYPLYATHMPIAYLLSTWKRRHPNAPVGNHVCQTIGILTCIISVGYASLKLYDKPLQKILKKRLQTEWTEITDETEKMV